MDIVVILAAYCKWITDNYNYGGQSPLSSFRTEQEWLRMADTEFSRAGIKGIYIKNTTINSFTSIFWMNMAWNENHVVLV